MFLVPTPVLIDSTRFRENPLPKKQFSIFSFTAQLITLKHFKDQGIKIKYVIKPNYFCDLPQYPPPEECC